MVRYLRLLLFPFSIIYGAVVIIRNILYDTGIFKAVRFNMPVISVGNLAIGGAGKTPLTEYLVRILGGNRIAILSRGYGRDTRGFIKAGVTDTASTIGDEPMQYFRKFPDVTIAVCENRVEGIDRLKEDHDVIILDDAYQHRRVIPGISLLVFEFRSLFRTQMLLPAGNLREPFNGYKRADVLLVSKAPVNLTEAQAAICESRFDAGRKPVYSSITYGDLKGVFSDTSISWDTLTSNTEVLLLTGIANPDPLKEFISKKVRIKHHFDFPDHYKFKQKDIQAVKDMYFTLEGKEKIIITTEKDAQRLFSDTLNKLLLDLPVYYQPIEIELHEDGKRILEKKIIEYVASAKRNR
ncbi:MAG: tetraacyldisaccharide 4'-kinase [Pedobacter sp.]|nr:MAG: tetraacyldisaccharide 4'-kinase [Pedobacter sp.]